MERSTVQSCLAAPVFLSRNPYKTSINPRFRLVAGFGHFSYFGRNRPRKRVPTDTRLAQRFAFCLPIQTEQPAAISLRATRAATDRVRAFGRSIRPRRVIERDPEAPSALVIATFKASMCAARINFQPRSMTRALNRSRATYGLGDLRQLRSTPIAVRRGGPWGALFLSPQLVYERITPHRVFHRQSRQRRSPAVLAPC
jgi:hypothetical protein